MIASIARCSMMWWKWPGRRCGMSRMRPRWTARDSWMGREWNIFLAVWRFVTSSWVWISLNSPLQCFPDKDELLRNMMGLLGNVAEVKSLRYRLMTPEYIIVFSDLLDSNSDGIEVSYNAAGVLAHIASDGAEAWTITSPTREEVLDRMFQAIDRWSLETERNINYRSFEPILGLIKCYDTPACQIWAVWALANLTKVSSKRNYCSSNTINQFLVVGLSRKVLQAGWRWRRNQAADGPHRSHGDLREIERARTNGVESVRSEQRQELHGRVTNGACVLPSSRIARYVLFRFLLSLMVSPHLLFNFDLSEKQMRTLHLLIFPPSHDEGFKCHELFLKFICENVLETESWGCDEVLNGRH